MFIIVYSSTIPTPPKQKSISPLREGPICQIPHSQKVVKRMMFAQWRMGDGGLETRASFFSCPLFSLLAFTATANLKE